MPYLRFLDFADASRTPLLGSYDPWLVALSFGVATVAAHAALIVAERVAAAETTLARRTWLAAGAVSMGAGIWAMHFIGMLAFRLPIPVTYDVSVTLLSMAPATLASAVVLAVICRTGLRPPELVVGGVLMGLGIGAMHYTGMAAMRMNADMAYDPVLFGVSIVVAVVLATLGLYSSHPSHRHRHARFQWSTPIASLVMGTAVVGMHYTGMASAQFFPRQGQMMAGEAIDPTLLALWVGLATAVIVGFALLLTLVDARLQAATRSARTSQTRLTLAVASMSDGFCLFDAKRRLVLHNDRFRELFPDLEAAPGTPLEDVVREAASQGLPLDTGGDVDRWLADRVEATRRLGGEIFRVADGRWLQVSWSRTAENETPVLLTDVTELTRARKDAEAANRAKSQFLSNMSHELRTPLNGVLGYTQILQRDDRLNETQRTSLESIAQCGHHLLSLINEVLDLSKIESGSVDAESQPCDLRQLTDGVFDVLRPKAEVKHLAFELEVAPQVPTGIMTDATKLRQILVNLLGNAVKFTDNGSVSLSVTLTGTQQLQFTVADTGVGIAPDEIDGIFDPFKQVESGKAAEGTGLGLAISRGLAAAMAGSLDVESELGRGSRFRLLLPFVKVTDGAALGAIAGAYPDGPRRALAPGQDVAVLVADDRATNRDILVRLLRDAGFRTDEAADGAEALEKLQTGDYRLVLMDVRMPNMDGLEATRAIRRDPRLKDTVVIAVSASLFSGAREETVEAGADDFIGKPLRVSEVFAKIERHVGVRFVDQPAEAPQTQGAAAGGLPSAVATEFVARLRDAMDMGDVATLRMVGEELGQHSDEGARLGGEIARLIRAFDFEGLRRLADTIDPDAER